MNHSDLQIFHSFKGIKSTAIGILECWLPQISEHCPYNVAGKGATKLIWLIRPGTASALTPKEGTVQECNTSDLVTKRQI